MMSSLEDIFIVIYSIIKSRLNIKSCLLLYFFSVEKEKKT